MPHRTATAPTAGADIPPEVRVEVVRSARRRRTISAHRDGDRIVVAVPARMTRAEEAEWVGRMVRRVLAGEQRRRRSDGDLLARAQALSTRHLGGRAVPAGVRWVDNQRTLWGSCTPADRTIRLSRRLVGMPDYVVDYVLLHELAHLLVPGHGAAFWALLDGYPRLERARGYLEGVSAAAGLPDLPDLGADGERGADEAADRDTGERRDDERTDDQRRDDQRRHDDPGTVARAVDDQAFDGFDAAERAIDEQATAEQASDEPAA